MVARVLFPVLPCGGTRLHPHHRATIKALERYPVSFLPFPTSSALAPTNHPASYLSSRLRLMPLTADLSAFAGYSALPMNLLNRIIDFLPCRVRIYPARPGSEEVKVVLVILPITT